MGYACINIRNVCGFIVTYAVDECSSRLVPG